MRSLQRVFVNEALPPLIAFIVLILLWEGVVRGLGIPIYLLPAPSASIETLFRLLSAGWTEPTYVGGPPTGIMRDAYVTLTEAVVGLVAGSITGLALGTLMAHSRFAEQSIYPVVAALRATPIIAIAPIFIIWFGVGVAPKAVVAAISTFFPMLVNSVVGMRSIDPQTLEFFQSVRASTREIFWNLRVPNTLPYFFTGLRLCVSLALIGAMVGELVGSREGLGHMMIATAVQLRTTETFSGIVVLSAIGITLTAIVQVVQARVLSWHESERVS
ncbi:MAG: ABC transporter permease [Chloroflexi bacterium]|nr:ABC transporter permease [Chloroflexota bacterium]